MDSYKLTLTQIKNIVEAALTAAGGDMTKGEIQNLTMISDGICGRLIAKQRKEVGERSDKLMDFLNDKANSEL